MNYKIKKLALLLAIAASNSARAQQPQVQMLLPNKSYTFSSDTAATGSGSITYQWYRDGMAIEGATNASYALPANLAQGKDVEFKRGAMSSTCPGEVTFSNIFYVSFCGLIINNTCWAYANASTANTFASRPDEYTPLFQWNKIKAWPATGAVIGWDTIASPSMSNWSANNPCPEGWLLPSESHLMELNASGTTWAPANSARGNAIAGRFYGPTHASADSCSLPNHMNNCIFLPAMSYRRYSERGGTIGVLGYYWSSWAKDSDNSYLLFFNTTGSFPATNHKGYGMSVRCVQ